MDEQSAGSKALRQWRLDLGLNQTEAAVRLSEAARAAGMALSLDPWYLSKIERGVRKPGRVLAILLRDVAGVSVDAWDEPAESDASDDSSNDHAA